MPKTATIQTNFTGGELSPFLLGRIDVAKYHNGVARMQNFHPIIQGGSVSRQGSRYLGVAKNLCRLLPFVFDRSTTYQLELGTHLGACYLRIWRANGTQVESSPGVPLELVPPYLSTELAAVRWEQAEDTVYLWHNNHPQQRIQRFSDTSWRLEAAPYVTAPFNEQGFASTTDVTLSAATVGTGRTFTAAAGVFLPGDVGRDFESGPGGVATLTAYTSNIVMTGDITSAFPGTALTDFTLTDSPYAHLFANQKDPVGSTVSLFAAISRPASITLTAKTGSITIDASAAVFVAGDTGKYLYADAGVALLTFVSAVQCTAVTSNDFLRTSYQVGAWGITGDAFRSTDVGSYVNLNGGLFLVTAFSFASLVSARILVSPTALVSAPPGAWSMSSTTFGATGGYPRCGALHEQRLVLAATIASPLDLWWSRIREYLDFEPGLLDDDGFTYTLAARTRNPVQHLVSGKRLFVLTGAHEITVRGGNEKAIGPTNIQKSTETSYGSGDVRPVVIGTEVLYVHGAGRKVRAMGYSPAAEGFDSPDRTVFAEHITESGVVDMAYQPEAHSLVYCVRSDGLMAVAAYDVAQEVIAWSRYITDGVYIAVSVIPTPTGDDVWTAVMRPDAAGAARYFIERFEADLATDSASTIAIDDPSGPGTLTLTGLDRFEGQALSVKADEANMGPLTVSGGIVTLPREAYAIEAGLPIIAELEMLPPEVGGQTAQGSNLSKHEVIVRVLDTATLEINGQVGDFREFGTELLDQPPPSFSGDYREFTLTDDLYRDTLVFRQALPFKTHISAVIRKLTFNDT